MPLVGELEHGLRIDEPARHAAFHHEVALALRVFVVFADVIVHGIPFSVPGTARVNLRGAHVFSRS